MIFHTYVANAFSPILLVGKLENFPRLLSYIPHVCCQAVGSMVIIRITVFYIYLYHLPSVSDFKTPVKLGKLSSE